MAGEGPNGRERRRGERGGAGRRKGRGAAAPRGRTRAAGGGPLCAPPSPPRVPQIPPGSASHPHVRSVSSPTPNALPRPLKSSPPCPPNLPLPSLPPPQPRNPHPPPPPRLLCAPPRLPTTPLTISPRPPPQKIPPITPPPNVTVYSRPSAIRTKPPRPGWGGTLERGGSGGGCWGCAPPPHVCGPPRPPRAPPSEGQLAVTQLLVHQPPELGHVLLREAERPPQRQELAVLGGEQWGAVTNKVGG